MSSLLFSSEEVHALTGYKWPSKQLDELHRQGFFRARIGKAGNVLLERVHYESVCSEKLPKHPANAPRVRSIRGARERAA